MKERLQKLLAQANIASRRASEDLINKGRVRVNGEIAKVGDKADPDTDVIEVDGVRLNFDSRSDHVYIMLNKPMHVLVTDKPHRTDNRQTVNDLIGRKEHLFSVGRLDADSEGMVVMTNDGDLAQRLSHPRYRHTKTYRIEVLGLPTAETLERWQQGIYLEDGKTAPCFVEVAKGSVKNSVLRVVMTEGKKRQIRRVAAALGHPVRRLVRTHIGRLALGDLETGHWRELTPKEVLALKTPSPEIKLVQTRSAASERPVADMASTPSAPDKRRSPRSRSDSADQTSVERRRSSRRSTTEPSDETPKPRRQADTSIDDAPKPRRTPRTRKSDSHDDQWGKPPAPRPRKPQRQPRARKDRHS